MLFPTLPPPAEERSIAVGGNPLGDHVAYFASSSILPWRIAGTAMGDSGRRASAAIDAIDRTLSAYAARRRLLRIELLVAVMLFTTLPSIAAGATPLAVIGHAGVWVLATSILLSLVFAFHETRANRRVLVALAGAIASGRDVGRHRMPVERGKRALPTMLLLVVFVACLGTTLQLIGYPSEDTSSHRPLAYMATIVFGYLMAVGAGYRPMRSGLVAGVAFCSLAHLATVPPVAHRPDVPAVLAQPGVVVLLFGWLLVLLVVWLLRTERVG
jgi:hypothetical protein